MMWKTPLFLCVRALEEGGGIIENKNKSKYLN